MALKAFIVALTLTAKLALPQTANTTPAFEVASVKPALPGGIQGSMIIYPGQIISNSIDLRRLLMRAYGLDTDQISGPAWIDSEKYAVAAKFPPGTTPAQLQVMLQNLLADRFRLALHHENREYSVYELVVAKGGPKLINAAAPPADASTEVDLSDRTLDKDGCPVFHPGVHSGFGKFGSGVTCSRFTKYSMPEFVMVLASDLGMEEGVLGSSNPIHVIDKTGLRGEFDITLKFHLVPRFPGQSAPPSDGVDGPSIFTAVEQQIGLKLQKTKATLDRIVIDQASRIPTEN